ncbi:dicer-like protein 4 isoform X2 [Lycium barbarum]|uniref:dicer-like protein 4 isoform X2 n=1 Tax=Lycium barbarum TaxID=112863 RepID=UPI00293F1DD7|nr:dicer-like protein 4 isoform X2 [Lycium barbarum]
MEGGEFENGETSGITNKLSVLSLNADVDSVEKSVKDPRKIARKYQMDLCRRALKENVVVYLGTGCGKTHIAVLLIYEMGQLIRKPQKSICVFLAPTVALVEQQAKVIEDSIDFKVGTYCGKSKHLKSHQDWEKEMEEYEVLVMTPQVLLHNLSHCYIRIEFISLLIFDECHYAQVESDHPYAEIMKIFYRPDAVKVPRIFGMTASPVSGKGATIEGLETLLRSKVCSVEDKDELEQFVASPKVNVYYYGRGSSCLAEAYSQKLEEIKHQCVKELHKKPVDSTLMNTKKMLKRLHGHLIFSLEHLGVLGALQASCILLKGDHHERHQMVEAEVNASDDSLCDKYLRQVDTVFTSGCAKDGMNPDLAVVEVMKEPYFSKKLLRLIGILSNFGVQPDMKCIIFVNRIVTARSLSYMLQRLKVLSSWKCGFLVGVHSGLKSMSRKNTSNILNKFRSGELNLLVATKVGEEGLDIQTCCLVIRFDLPETVASFIQSRGRARMPKSEYAFLVDSGNERELELIQHFTRNEARMNEEISSRKSCTTVADFQENIYKVDVTGATISSASSISLVHHYCSKLPRDEYFCPKPQFFYFDDIDGTICKLILPSNAAMHHIVSAPQSSNEAAKKDACLSACKRLHELGALTDYLLPDQADEDEDPIHDFSDLESSDGEDAREELHQMIVPAAFKEPWTETENPVCLNSYYIKFLPRPIDRVYKKFGLFLKAPLPQEAERMKLDLNLDRGRSVETELIPSGATNFEKNEIQLAEKFQRMFLKIILDRSEFISEFVSLEKNDYVDSASKFYLLLPVNLFGHNKISVDWELVRRCLSSPIFGTSVCADNNEISKFDEQLQLANGSKRVHDVTNSLVYVPCKDTFFFISDVVKDKNADSMYKYSKKEDSKTHVEHYYDNFSVRLSYPDQPLIKAKQLFCLDNLLRKKGNSELRDKEEHFIELPPEICQLKIVGFSKDIGSSLSLLPSMMHRLESLLVAIELKGCLSASFPEGKEVAIDHVLQALTTEKCNEAFSLERLEVLGDAFLKFAVGRHLFLSHNAFDEGQLTRKRSNTVNNSNLYMVAIRNNLQAYIRDRSFEPNHFYVVGRLCPVICNEQTQKNIHGHCGSGTDGEKTEIRCSKCHHWLRKKTIADIVEALVGAFVVDSGFKAAIAFLKWIGIHTDFKEPQVRSICSASKVFMPLADEIDVLGIENLLGYSFVHKGLLIQAFIHPSYNNHGGGCYQRLEFLGDAVLDYLITSYLYSVYPELKPGQLTDLRSFLVNNNTFAVVAVRQSFHRYVLCDSSGLRESITRYANFIGGPDSVKRPAEEPACPKALGDLVESCMGAILLDTGFDLNRAWHIMLSFLKPVMSFTKVPLNPSRELHELCQSYGWHLEFPSLKEDNKFLVEAKVNGKNFSAAASALNINKKAAERMAAQKLCSSLKAEGYRPKSKTLEQVLKTANKEEPKLIGYDETPCVVAASCDDLEKHETSESDRDLKVSPISEELARNCNFKFKPGRKKLSPEAAVQCNSEQTIMSNGSNADSKATGGSKNESAKSRLHEMCAACCWKPPIFECCKETGLSHLKEFTFRVVVEIEETSRVIESYGEPRAKKKDAAEHAAEGALWFLKKEGYLFDN